MGARRSVMPSSMPPSDVVEHAWTERRVGTEFLEAPDHPSHFVHFYQDEDALFDLVGQFLLAGLRAGDRLLVIAGPEHREGLARRLMDTTGAYPPGGRIAWLDVRETLSKFMVDGAPDAARFRSFIDEVLADAKIDSPQRVRAYGEMVDTLWRSGNGDAAIRLEELWGEAGASHALSLLCAYTKGGFYGEGAGARLLDVHRQHTHLLIDERREAPADAVQDQIARYQELEQALRAALRRRVEVEEELRETLRREREARDLAQEAMRSRDLFAGMLGHDLRNPLSTILTTARIMLMRGDVVPERRNQLDRMIASGVRMQRMIEQLLDVTRDRLAGGIPVERKWQDVDALVASMVEEASAANPTRELVYRSHGDCWASVDSDRFEQVVANLLGNALSHGAPDNAVMVSLSGDAFAISLAVHNQGAPIDPDFLPFLFDPFSRPAKTRSRSEGLGLGLFIVDGIVRAHEGTVTVSSSAAVGTIFKATLPKHERKGA